MGEREVETERRERGKSFMMSARWDGRVVRRLDEGGGERSKWTRGGGAFGRAYEGGCWTCGLGGSSRRVVCPEMRVMDISVGGGLTRRC